VRAGRSSAGAHTAVEDPHFPSRFTGGARQGDPCAQRETRHDPSASPASCPVRCRATHRGSVARCTPARAATSTTSAPSRTARTASGRCSTTDKTTSANPGLPVPTSRGNVAPEDEPVSQITWRRSVALQSPEDSSLARLSSAARCRIEPYLDQGGSAALRRWPGVSAGLCLGRPARRTPGHAAPGPADKNGPTGQRPGVATSHLPRAPDCPARGHRRQMGTPGALCKNRLRVQAFWACASSRCW
jgi:hypothetical protein